MSWNSATVEQPKMPKTVINRTSCRWYNENSSTCKLVCPQFKRTLQKKRIRTNNGRTKVGRSRREKKCNRLQSGPDKMPTPSLQLLAAAK
jgi:hypothetical protein